MALLASSILAEKTRNIRELFETGGMKRSDLTAYLDSAREGVEMGVLNLHRASELIRSFKMVAADQVSEVRRRFMVREYVEEILLSLRPKLKKTAHRVEVECDADLCIDSYPGAFSQILTNFVINSLTHAFDEGQAGVIRIAVRMDGAALVLSYSDDGRDQFQKLAKGQICLHRPHALPYHGGQLGNNGRRRHLVHHRPHEALLPNDAANVPILVAIAHIRHGGYAVHVLHPGIEVDDEAPRHGVVPFVHIVHAALYIEVDAADGVVADDQNGPAILAGAEEAEHVPGRVMAVFL